MAQYLNQTTRLVDELEVPLPDVSVYVFTQSGALADLEDSVGAPIDNPVISDDNGNFSFYADDGVYTLEYHYGGRRIETFKGEQVGEGIPLPASILLALAAPGGSSIVGFEAAGTGAVTRDAQDKMRETTSLLDRGADDTGVTAAGTALSNALTTAYADGNRPVVVTNGDYKFTGKTTITQGVPLLGSGAQGSTEGYGTVLKHFSNGDFLEWNGNGADSAGTGGGARDLLIQKASGQAGGTAIKLLATDDAHRPGECVYSNILIAADRSGTPGTWERGFVIDGSACDTDGARGVRSTLLIKTRVANVTTAGESYLFKNATHLFGLGLQADTGDGATSGIRFSLHNENVHLHGINIDGPILIDANNGVTPTLKNGVLTGEIGTSFTNNDTLATGVVALSLPTAGGFVITNMSPNMAFYTNLNPDFAVARSASAAGLTNATGDNTAVTVAWDVEKRDRGNLISGTATAVTFYCAGTYDIAAALALTSLGAGHTGYELNIIHTKALGGSDTYTATGNPGAIRNAANAATVEISRKIAILHEDTIAIQISVSGDTKTVGIYGADSGAIYSLFTAKYQP